MLPLHLTLDEADLILASLMTPQTLFSPDTRIGATIESLRSKIMAAVAALPHEQALREDYHARLDRWRAEREKA